MSDETQIPTEADDIATVPEGLSKPSPPAVDPGVEVIRNLLTGHLKEERRERREFLERQELRDASMHQMLKKLTSEMLEFRQELNEVKNRVENLENASSGFKGWQKEIDRRLDELESIRESIS